MPLLLIALLAISLIALSLGIVSLKTTVTVSGYANGSGSVTVTDAKGETINPTVPKAQAATLTTRTNNTSGSLTMTSGSHGIITGQRLDLHWTGGHCYNAIAGTVAGSVVPIASVGGGDSLPIATTAIRVGIATETEFNITGDNLQAVFLQTGEAGYIIVSDDSSDLLEAYIEAGGVWQWTKGIGGTNPLAGDTPTKVWMSHGNTALSVDTMKLIGLVH